MLRSAFRPDAEIRRLNSEEFLFVIPIFHATDFKIVLCRDKLENLPCPQVLAAIGRSDYKPPSGSSFIRSSLAFFSASRTSR